MLKTQTPPRGAFDYLLRAPNQDEGPQAPPPPPPERGPPPRVHIVIDIVEQRAQAKRGYRIGTISMALIGAAILASLVGGCTSAPGTPGLITTAKFDYNTIVKSEYSWVPGACKTSEHMDSDGRTWGEPIIHLPDGTRYPRPSYQWTNGDPTAKLPVCAEETAEAARRNHLAEVAFRQNTVKFTNFYNSQSPAMQAEMRRLDALPIEPGYTTIDNGDGVLRTWSKDQRAGHFHGCDSYQLSGVVQTNCY